MKKIFALCSLIICVSLVLTVFVSCGKEPDNETTTTTEENIISVENGEFKFTAEIGADNAVLKNNGEEYQTLHYPSNAGFVFNLEYAKKHSEFIDMNFDGQPDFYIAASVNGETIYYYCWLFNATTKKFDPSPSLTGLTNISVDAEKQVVYSSQYIDGDVKIVEYVWVNGMLTYKNVYDNADDTIPEEITEAAQQNAIGTVTKPVTEQAVDTQSDASQPDDTQSNSTQQDTDKPDSTQPEATQQDTTQSTTTQSEVPTTTEENKTTTTNNNTSTTTTTNATSESVTLSTTEESKPLNTTTTAPRQGGIQIESGNINDGWY